MLVVTSFLHFFMPKYIFSLLHKNVIANLYIFSRFTAARFCVIAPGLRPRCLPNVSMYIWRNTLCITICS